MTVENVTLTDQAFNKSKLQQPKPLEIYQPITEFEKKKNVNVVIIDLYGLHQISQKYRQNELPSKLPIIL